MSVKNTDEIKNAVLELWNKQYTGGQIAKELCLTRNAVMGIVDRLKKKGLIDPRPKLPPKIEPPKVVIKTKKMPPVFIKPKPVNHIPKTLMQLRQNSCRYVVNDGPASQFLFCGKPKEKGAYCMDHAKLCYVKPHKLEKKEKEKEKVSSFSLKQLIPRVR